MKIEHIAMYVNDLEGARDSFVKYLGGVSNDGYHKERDSDHTLSLLMTGQDLRS